MSGCTLGLYAEALHTRWAPKGASPLKEGGWAMLPKPVMKLFLPAMLILGRVLQREVIAKLYMESE